MNDFLFAIIFFLPAGVANAAPVFANKIPYLNNWKTPIDFGMKLNGKRMLGDNKTWRGLLFGGLIGGLTGWLLYHFISSADVQQLAHLWIGFILGMGALFGDALESFFKRQLNIKSGQSWFPYDQIDFVLGAILFSLPIIQLRLVDYLAVLAFYFGLHIITSYIGYKLKLKDKPI